jgi:hypothetical protein
MRIRRRGTENIRIKRTRRIYSETKRIRRMRKIKLRAKMPIERSALGEYGKRHKLAHSANIRPKQKKTPDPKSTHYLRWDGG